jgi:predicted Zn-dependent protease
MAKDPKNPDAPGSDAPKTWDQELYAPERIQKWMKGELNMAQLDGFTGADMLEFAQMGYAQYENGKYEEARVIFMGLIALDGKEPYYRTALGCVFMAQEKLDRAIENFTDALTVDPTHQAALVNRGEAYLRDGKVVEAATDFKAAVDLDPKNESPYSVRARALAAAALETLEAVAKDAANDAKETSQSRGKPLAPQGSSSPKKK